MADTDWGWRKRSDDEDEGLTIPADEDTDVDKRSKVHNSYYTPYRYRQPYSLASTSYMPYKWVLIQNLDWGLQNFWLNKRLCLKNE